MQDKQDRDNNASYEAARRCPKPPSKPNPVAMAIEDVQPTGNAKDRYPPEEKLKKLIVLYEVPELFQ